MTPTETPELARDAMASFAAPSGSADWVDAKPLPCGGNDYHAVPEGEYTTDCLVRERDGSLDMRREHHRNGAGFLAAANRGAQVLALRYPPNEALCESAGRKE